MYDIAIINRLPNGLLLGFNYYPADDNYRYEEFSLYVFIVQFRLRIYE